MTKFEVEIISRETIKPSSPTPPHLRTFKFSLLDQMSSIAYPPLILYYSSPQYSNADHDVLQTDQDEDPSAKLKRSLSQTLTRFFPLAGRIKENRFVDCNDEGVLFLVAEVSCPLSELLKQPPLEELDRFLPLQVISNEPPEVALQLAFQLNLFSCGGIAIGVGASHKVMDGMTICAFLRCWAAIAGSSETACMINKLAPERVDCVAASLFPARESLPAHASAWLGRSLIRRDGKSTSTRRFVFLAEAISKLKAKAKGKSTDQAHDHVPINPTSMEVLSGFIWKCLMNASKVASGNSQIRPSVLANAVSLRHRMEPPLPQHTVGNIVWKAYSCYDHHTVPVAKSASDDHILDLQGFVGLMRNSISEINSKYVQRLLGDEGLWPISKWLEEVAEMYSSGKQIYEFSSLRNMGLNEVDFGWGRPAWISLCELRGCKDFVMFVETRRGDGIDAWVVLDEHEMSILENDPEFLAFASVNPGISCFIT